MFRFVWFVVSAFVLSVLGTKASPALKFDIVTFCCPCSTDDHLCDEQFDHLNYPSTNGHYVAMGSDAHRLELATNGNALAIYYNTFNDGWPTNSGAEQAQRIDQYAINGFTSNGPKPNWVILNEISTTLWTGNSSYRAWVHDVVHSLKNTYGYNIALYSPFSNPGANAVDWQAVTEDAYIGIENYLSGAEVSAHSFSVSWCQGQYQSSITSYTSVGAPRAKLMLGEDFAQTTNGTSWGRSGVTSNEWDAAIIARNQAEQNVGFAGFLSFAWSKNAMLASDDELIHFEDTYRTNQLPVSSGITAPFILLQQQSQTVPAGADVGFTVFRAGTALTSYQWRFNGSNLVGETSSSLNLTNVQVSAAGNYSVWLSNASGTVVSSNAFLSVRVPDALAWEPFAPAITSYTPGANLIGQTNSVGQRWTQAGPTNANQPIIQGGNLAAGGLAWPAGNSVRFGGDGTSARFNPGTNTNAGSWYYSLSVRLADITGLSSSGFFWLGFNNSSGTQTTTPTSVATRVIARATNGGFQLGLDKSSGSPTNFVFAAAIFSTNDIIFLVGSYTFNPTTTNDDLSQLWINPPASSFGLANAPAPTLTSTAGTDLSQLASLVLFNRNAAEPAQIIADEIRLGSSWASVTPPAEPQAPAVLNIARSGNSSVLSWTTNAPGYILEAAAALGAPNLWNAVTGPVYVIGDQFVVTNVAANPMTFFRLREPQ